MATERIPLGEHGQDLYDSVKERLGVRLLPSDEPALHMACKWLDRFHRFIDEDGNTDVKLGIATDKFLLLSAKFGFTPRDRKDTGDDSKTTKKIEKKRTALDSLSPDRLSRNGS